MALPQPALAPGLVAPEIASAPAGEDPETRARIDRLKARFLYCYTHPLWDKWRRDAAEDLAFVTGEQWDADIRKKLEAERRTVLTINQIRPVIEVLVGYERASRLEIRPVPEGQEDLEDVTILGRLLKRTMEDCDGEFELSDGFKEGISCGLAVFHVGVDYETNPLYGEPYIEKMRAGEVIWDPDWRRYDLSDAREVFCHRMVAIDTLIAQYPEQEDEIRQAVEVYRAGGGQAREIAITRPTPVQAYRLTDPMTSLVPLYDEDHDTVRVLEAEYRDWTTVFLVANARTGDLYELDGEEGDAVRAAREQARVDPDVSVLRKARRKVKMSLLLPALGIELEHGTRFDNDDETYSYVPYIAYREGDELLGLVRNLKDPQREVNKRRSAIADNVARFGNIKWFALRASLENPADLESGQGSGFVYWGKSGGQPPMPMVPPPMPDWVWRQDQIAKMEIREISGINADLLGHRDSDASGIAIARRQQQGQIVATPLFDNYKRTKRIIGKRLAKRIQQVYTGERTLRLDTSSGGSEFVTLNTTEIRNGRAVVVRDVPSLKYDVVIADAPSTPTARALSLGMLLEVIQRIPQASPALMDVIVELTDIPNREAVLQRVRVLMAQAGMPVDPQTGATLPAPPPGAGGMPGAGGPPGGEPPPRPGSGRSTPPRGPGVGLPGPVEPPGAGPPPGLDAATLAARYGG